MQRIIAGNWKMHGTQGEASALLAGIAPAVKAASGKARIVICPPFPLLSQVKSAISGWEGAGLGGQDCHTEASGAFTGDISAPLLKDIGCQYVILGHSERRQGHGEDDALIASKLSSALSANLTPILCVGETLEERESGKAEAVVERQVMAALAHEIPDPLIIAYEPVWAIGTGKVASTEDVKAMHQHIRSLVTTKKSVEQDRVAVLYGGSVKPGNAPDLFALSEVDGVLVGGASLNAADFSAIIAAA